MIHRMFGRCCELEEFGYADGSSTVALIDQRTLLGIVTEEAEPDVVETVEAPRVCTVRTRRGSEIVVTEIPCTN